MARTSRVVYPCIKKKIGFLNELLVFCSAGNVGDFCSFKGYGAGANRPKIQKFVKNYIRIFSQTKCIFVTNQVKPLMSQNIRKIKFLIRNRWSVFTETRS